MSKILRVAKDLFDIFYPIGSYYETSNANWTPQGAGWYGTWVEDTAGKTTVAKDSRTFKTLGASVGSETHNHTLKNGFALIYGGDSHIVLKHKDTSTTQTYDQWQSAPHNEYNPYSTNTATALGGTTDNGSSIQPSIVVRRWHRTA